MTADRGEYLEIEYVRNVQRLAGLSQTGAQPGRRAGEVEDELDRRRCVEDDHPASRNRRMVTSGGSSTSTGSSAARRSISSATVGRSAISSTSANRNSDRLVPRSAARTL